MAVYCRFFNNERLTSFFASLQFQDTSACLFDWKREVDKKIIHEGPFEFRLVERPEEDPLGCLSLEWRKYIETRNQGRQKSESCVVS